MVSKIINPLKITKESIPAPSFEKLKNLTLKTYEEISNLCYLLKRESKKKTGIYLEEFIHDCLLVNGNRLLSLLKFNHRNLNESLVIHRSFLETMVDLFWVYSIHIKNPEQSENLAKRFYQFGAKEFDGISDRSLKVLKSDPFFKDIDFEGQFTKSISDAKNLNIIPILDSNSEKKLRYLQKSNWRALPGLVKHKSEIDFRNRSNIAKELVLSISNLKNAPYQFDWELLNAFTHWTALNYKTLDEMISEAMYCRNLNIFLGFLHDMLNVVYKYLNQNVPQNIQTIRNEFIYFST